MSSPKYNGWEGGYMDSYLSDTYKNKDNATVIRIEKKQTNQMATRIFFKVAYPELSEAFQKILFKNGIVWVSDAKIVKNTEYPYLLVSDLNADHLTVFASSEEN